MEFLELTNVSFPVGMEYTRIVLLRLFEQIGSVEDILLDRCRGRAMLSYTDPLHLQEAMMSLDGFLLFGRTLSLRVAPPPVCVLPGFIASAKPSKYLLVHGVSYMAVVVKLKHVDGVITITSAGVQRCFVELKCSAEAADIRELLTFHPNRWGHCVTTQFLRKLC